MNKYDRSEEFSIPPDDYTMPEEPCVRDNEFNQTTKPSAASGTESAHSKLKKLLLLPVVASVSAVSVLFSAIGFDPLGEDIFNSDEYMHHHDHVELMPWDQVDDYYRVTYLPTGEEFESEEPNDMGYEQIRWWVEEQGGNPDSIRIVDYEMILVDTVYSDDYIGVGDEDAPDDIYVAQGQRIKIYKRLNICEADEFREPDDHGNYGSESADDSFPRLTNLEPNGPVFGEVIDEQFIIWQTGDEEKYIYAGDRFTGELSEVPGISYDESSNTLTLSGVTEGIINVNLMGNGFRLYVDGDNSIDRLIVWGYHYGGSVTITGNGRLTVNRNNELDVGIYLKAEESESCVMIDYGVELEVFGSSYAILVESTLLEKSIYYLNPLTLEDGRRVSSYNGSGSYDGYIADDSGYTINHAVFR